MMKNSIIFVSGVYGTGKSTISAKLSDRLKMPHFSSGDLISRVNGEIYGANKVVADKKANQDILAKEVQSLVNDHSAILLAGHFCIFGVGDVVELLPEIVFEKMPLSLIVLLEADTEIVSKHLTNRDKRNYNFESIKNLQKVEHAQAVKIAAKLSIPIIKHKMCYTSDDVDCIVNAITKGATRNE